MLFFSLVSLHRKWNRTRWLSAQIKWTCCVTSRQDLRKWENFRKILKSSALTNVGILSHAKLQTMLHFHNKLSWDLKENSYQRKLNFYSIKRSWNFKWKKQPPRDVPRTRCSENMQQIYWRTPIHTSAWVFSCKFATYFQNTFY